MGDVQVWLQKLEIQEVLIRYARALDERKPALFDDVFLSDAELDYRAAGGVCGDPGAWQEWVHATMARFDSWQHLLTNFVIDVAGDRATAFTRCYNPLQGRAPGGGSYVLHVGCSYDDQLVRTAKGWRIQKRVLGMDWLDDSQAPAGG